MNAHSFAESLAWSKGVVRGTDADTLRLLIAGCIDVRKGNEVEDKAGIDFVATLRRGATVNVDLKARHKGTARHWRFGEPELTLEWLSVLPEGGRCGVTGWTLDEAKQTDYVLYLFDREECDTAYLVPFQLLRMAFRANLDEWRGRYGYRDAHSFNGRRGWTTRNIFVPASVVLAAVSRQMEHDNERITKPASEAVGACEQNPIADVGGQWLLFDVPQQMSCEIGSNGFGQPSTVKG